MKKFLFCILLFFGAVLAEDSEDSSFVTWSFNSEIAFYGSDYSEFGNVKEDSEMSAGSDVVLGVALELETGRFYHEFGTSISGSVSTESDSSLWSLTPEIEYTLFFNGFILDLGVEFNFASDRDLLLGYMLWTQQRLWKKNDYKVSVGLWGYYRDDQRIISNINVNWRKTVEHGLGGSVAIGAKLDRDTLATRVGPSSRLGVSYRFNHGFILELNENLFYGLVATTKYVDGGKINLQKANSELRFSWDKKWINVYIALSNLYRHYDNIPAYYEGILPRNAIYNTITLGTKVNF